jgi:hypothetical protein
VQVDKNSVITDSLLGKRFLKAASNNINTGMSTIAIDVGFVMDNINP